MVTENINTKKVISAKEYGDLSTNCLLGVVSTTLRTFVFGGIGIHLSFMLLNKVVYTNPATKILSSLCGGLALATYVAQHGREKCEAIEQMYVISRN